MLHVSSSTLITLPLTITTSGLTYVTTSGAGTVAGGESEHVIQVCIHSRLPLLQMRQERCIE